MEAIFSSLTFSLIYWACLAISVSPFIYQLYVTAAVYGTSYFKAAFRTFGIMVQSRRVFVVFFVALLPIAIVFSGARVHPLLLAGILTWLPVSLVVSCIPPTMLLLGTSRASTVDLKQRLKYMLYPYRAVVLFDPKVTSLHTWLERHQLEFDNFRTWTADWRTAVDSIVDFVPYVLIDTRIPTPELVYETLRLARGPHRSKTFFLTDSEGNAPATFELEAGEIAGIKLMKEREAMRMLMESALTRTWYTIESSAWNKLSAFQGMKSLNRGKALWQSCDIEYEHGVLSTDAASMQNETRIKEARHLIREAIELASESNDCRIQAQVNLAIALQEHGLLERVVNDLDQARSAYDRSRDILQRLLDDHPLNRDVLAAYRETTFRLGELAHATGDGDIAAKWYRKSLSLDEVLGHDDGQGELKTREALERLLN
jgi:hypothetical protein